MNLVRLQFDSLIKR